MKREILDQAIQVLGTEGITDAAILPQIADLVADPMTIRRLIVWIPEAFGIVRISHLGRMDLPVTFSAQDFRGRWQEIELNQEPVFKDSFLIAQQMHGNQPQDSFMRICARSALFNAVLNAMNAGESLDGCKLDGPVLVDIPADVYISN